MGPNGRGRGPWFLAVVGSNPPTHLLGSLWGHFGFTLGSSWGQFGITLGSLWDHFGVILGSSQKDFLNIPKCFFGGFCLVASAYFLALALAISDFLYYKIIF